jgi:GntR family transcriptional regulator
MPFKRPIHKALYLQVRDALAARVASGQWKPGMPVANEGDLARELGVSGGTVRKALELMEAQRLISRRQGRGTFVSDQTSKDQTARFSNLHGPDGQLVNGRVVSVDVTEGAASEHERLRLRLADGDTVYRVRRVWRHGCQNILVAHVAVPTALCPGLIDKREAAGSISLLAHEYGILLGKAEVRITIDLPPGDTAEALGVEPGTPVMCFQRTVFMLDGDPVESGTAHCYLPGGYYLAQIG